jgi:uncharacterized RDD family membrane protein YckC
LANPVAGFWRRIGATVYEALLLLALLVAVGFALLPLVTPASDAGVAKDISPSSRSLYLMSPTARTLSCSVMLAVSAAYCGWLWSGGRRTLAMKAWRLSLRTRAGTPVSLRRAFLRFAACLAAPVLAIAAAVALQPSDQAKWAVVLLAFNYAWALFDPARLFLQDRIAGTRLELEQNPLPRRLLDRPG